MTEPDERPSGLAFSYNIEGRTGLITMTFTPTELEFLSECVASCWPKDSASAELLDIANEARKKFNRQ